MFGLAKHCPVCGIDVKRETAIKRFGKYFCSEEHAQKYAQAKMAREEREPRRSGCC